MVATGSGSSEGLRSGLVSGLVGVAGVVMEGAFPPRLAKAATGGPGPAQAPPQPAWNTALLRLSILAELGPSKA